MRLNEENALLIKAKKNYGTYDVSGKSFKVNQLVDFSSVSTQTINGLTITNNNDGSLTISGTATAQVQLLFNSVQMYENHKYLLFGCASNGSSSTYALRIDNPTLVDYGDGAIGTASATNTRTPYLMLRQDVVFNNLVFKPRYIDLTDAFGTGNEPTTLSQFYATPQGQFLKKVGYIPYTLGKIIDSQSQYEFSGRNLYDKTNQTLMHTSNFISVLPNTTYRCLYDGDIANGCYWNEYDISKNTIIIGTDSNPNHTYNSKNFTFTTGANTYFVKIHLYFSVVRTNEQWLAIYNSMQLQLSTETETSYTPYFKPRKLLAQLPNGRDEHYSRNLCPNNFELGTIYLGNDYASTSAIRTPNNARIKVVGGTSYYLKGTNENTSTNSYIFEYDSSGTWLDRLDKINSNINNGLTYNLNANCSYIRIVVAVGTTNVLFQPSTETDTSYIPHIVNANYQELEYIESSGTRYTKTYQYVPCYRKLDLAIGLYDLTNDTFTAYSGTKGREIRHTNEIIKLGSLVKNGNFESTSGWSKTNYVNLTTANNEGIITVSTFHANDYGYSLIKHFISTTSKYFVYFEINSPYASTFKLDGNGAFTPTVSTTAQTCVANTWSNMFLTCTGLGQTKNVYLYPNGASANFSVGQSWKIRNFVIVDLTQLGLDTLTAQQFYDQYHDYLPLLASGLPPIYKPVIKLLSAGTAHDVYRNTSGKITENIGVVDLGSLTWNKATNGYFTAKVDNQKVYEMNSTINNMICSKYPTYSNANRGSYTDKGINYGYTGDTSWSIRAKDTSITEDDATVFKSAMSGVKLIYERNSSLTETLMQKIESVDLGSLTWTYNNGNFYSTNLNDLIKIPQSKELPNVFCKLYTNISWFDYGSLDKRIAINLSGNVYIRDSAYTDATSFKNSLSGIYLTYITTQTEPIPSIMLPTNATKCVDNNGVEMGMVKR